MERCFFHPEMPSEASCQGCGRPICGVCLKRVNTVPFCEACAANRYEQSPLLAGIFSLLVPGMGQVYNGEFGKGALIFLTGWLVAPWIYGVLDAVQVADEIRSGRRMSQTVPPGYIILALKIVLIPLACLYIGVLFALVRVFIGVVKLLLS